MRIKLLSSLEKCFLDEDVACKTEYQGGTMLLNEMFHFQIGYASDASTTCGAIFCYLSVESELADYISISRIEVVPVQYPAYFDKENRDFLRTEPGLYPDVLQPLDSNGRLIITSHLKSLMVEVNTGGKVPAGKYPITFCFTEDNDEKKQQRVTFELEIIDAELPEQELMFTQWLHCDSLKANINPRK